MRNHEIAVGWMHVVAGLFVLGCVSLLWVLAAQLAPSFEGTFVPELFKTFGRPIALVLLGLAGLDSFLMTLDSYEEWVELRPRSR